MRFKKLRISVGIALILFIFIAGSIIVSGKLIDKKPVARLDNQDQNAILVDPKQVTFKEIQIETKPIQSIEQPEPKVVESTLSSPKPVVVSRRTRAS